MGVITRDFTMFLPAGKNTFGYGNKWQKLNFGIDYVLSAVLMICWQVCVDCLAAMTVSRCENSRTAARI